MDRDAFELARRKIIRNDKQYMGIGTLSEKTLHAVLKLYYSPNIDFHEVAIDGYVADIYNGDEIIEIQTHNLGRLRSKLDVFLKNYKVTVVYPVIHTKYLIWIDPDTGEYSPKRRSPLKGSAYDAFMELFRIQDYVKNSNLNIIILLVDVEEYRIKNGYAGKGKKGSSRYDRIPLGVEEEIIIERPEDYRMFLPFSLPENFTSKEFSREAKISHHTAQLVLNFMTRQKIVNRIGKTGKSWLYEINE